MMEAKEFLKEWRIWMLIAALAGALLAVGPHYQTVETDQGESTIIATNIDRGLELAGGARVLIQPDLTDVAADEVDGTIEQIVTTLKTRVEAFGLQDMTIRPVSSLSNQQRFIQVEMAGASTDELRELISKQGIFRASLSLQVGPDGSFTIDGTEFQVEEQDGNPVINGQLLEQNRSVTLETENYEIPVFYDNRSGSTFNLRLQAFDGQDITGVDINPTQSGVSGSGDSYNFQFQVSITREAAERFQAIANNFEAPGRYLAGTQLVLTLDNQQISALNVASVFANQVVTTPSITGGEDSRDAAVREMNRLQSVLQSGALPVPIEVVSTDQVSPTLGAEFMRTAIIAIILGIVAVSILLFIRYQEPEIVFPIMITGFSEVFILLGVFSDGSGLFESGIGLGMLALGVGIPTIIGVTVGLSEGELSSLLLPVVSLFILGMVRFSTSLDLAAIAGIIAAVGTGVDDQIIITDERTEERIKSLKKRLKRAFFIIFTSAASTIGAMLPVMAIGAGAVQGFAITTILGVIIGITITRPAYARVLDKLDV